jgi:hypothetical protein
MSTSSVEDNANETSAPIVIDLGKYKKKSIKRLRQGKQGKLINDVQDCLEELRSNDVISGAVQPIVIVVREKPDNKNWTW